MKKLIPVLALAVAIVVASVAAIVVFNKKEAVARADAERAASEEETAAREVKRAQAERDTELARTEAEKAKESAEKLKQQNIAAEKEKARLEGLNLAEKKAIAAEERAKADAEAKAAADVKAAKDLEYKAAKENADAARAKEAAAADERAAAVARKAAAEAETLKLRTSMNQLEAERARYAELTAELLDMKRDLEERERALIPDRTAADLVWLGYDENGNETNALSIARKPAPENDPLNPPESRALAKAERLRRENAAEKKAAARDGIVSAMEAMIRTAYREDRIVDARHYVKTLKTIYPDWELKPEATEDGKEEEKK